MEAASSIGSALDAMRDRLIAWSAIGSGSDDPDGLRAMLAALRVDFARLPAAVAQVACGPTGAAALQVRCRPQAPVQALLVGHYDTVYGPGHPFRTPALRDPETLVGPGVLDMKGGLVVMLAALEELEAAPGRGGIGWEVLITPDEEIGSPHSAPLLREAAGRHDLAMIFEPAQAGGALVRGRPGTGVVSVTARGRAAHAGRNPGDGRNAIVALAELLAAVPAVAEELGVMLNVGSMRGGGPVNVVADRAEAEIDIRVRRAGDERRAVERLTALAAAIGRRGEVALDVAAVLNRPPREVDARDERLFDAYRGCARALGVELDWRDVGGGSDGNLLAAAGLPCLDGIGVRGGQAHSSEEFCELPSLPERAAIAGLLLRRLASGEAPPPGRP
jgi:glutamate carboxypeptidase